MTMTPPAQPAVSGGITSAATLSIPGLEDVKPGLLTLLSAALGTKALGLLDLTTLHDYAHGNQIGKTGLYWKGRKPADGNLLDALPQLVQDDQIGPSMDREVSALFGKEADWDAMREGDVLDAESELPTALALWQQESRLNDVLRDAARARWWAGRMVGRVSVPDDYAEQIRTNPPQTLADALELIYVESIDPRQGGPLIDAHGRTLGYWNRYMQNDAEGRSVTYVELYTLDRVYRLRETPGGTTYESLPDFEADNPMAGVGTARRPTFLMFHADRDGGSSISLSARDAQDRLNVVTTYKGRNDEQTGYRQFIVSNAETPTDPSGKPAAYQMGPAAVVNLVGLTVVPVELAAGEQPSRLTPKWEVVDPLNPADYHIPSMDDWIRRILDKFDQTWVNAPQGQSGVSGESKRQSRKPFERRVAFAAQDIGTFLAWALKAALMLAGMMLDRQAEFQDVAFTPKLTLDVDAANLEELKVKLLMWQAGGLSLDALLEATPGVTDVAQEKDRIQQDEATNPVRVAREDALKKLLDPGGQPTDQTPVEGMTFAGLGKAAGDVQQGVTVDFNNLLADLFKRLGSGATTASIRAALDQRARLGAFESFELGASAQQADLTGSSAVTAPLLDVGVAFSRQRAALVTERAGIVLSSATEALVSPYARLAAQILVTDAVRMGTRSSATVNGATRKQFVRLRPVKEPRAHSVLEGTIKPIDEPFVIAGIECYGPGDAALPWSEKAYCGHILKFLP